MTIKLIEPEKVSRFRVRGEAKLKAGITVAIHLKNTGSRDITITKVSHQIIAPGNSGFPNKANYFMLATGRTYNMSGELAQPLNIDDERNVPIAIYELDPLLDGEATEIDRIYTKEVGTLIEWEDDFIVKSQGTFEVSFVGDQSGGLINTRVYFNA